MSPLLGQSLGNGRLTLLIYCSHRERQAWFICEEGEEFTVAKLLAWMGDFTEEKVIAKHCARISLVRPAYVVFASPEFAFVLTMTSMLSPSVLLHHPPRQGPLPGSHGDARHRASRLVCPSIPVLSLLSLTSPSETHLYVTFPSCFTDGVGLISQTLLNQCARTLEGNNSPPNTYSAVQVRIGGAKGMLVAWPKVTGDRVVLRPSMVKFKSDHLKLGAMKVRLRA